ncbi:penicillin-binding protein 2, partial [Patescibacteria group bacterium]|nr:penicillin-binding protein 2 [Patescibacteria group bacterium]MBU1895349.1 penicillin-binding protein 2 [Patescibacteria group bacterium]
IIIIIILFIFLIFSRVIYLQLLQGDHYSTLSEGNREKIIPIPAERGLIFDRNGVQLTKNVPKLSISITPQDLPRNAKEREGIVEKLAEITEQDTDKIRNLLDEYGSYSYESIVIREDVDYETALNIQIASTDLPGINIQQGSKRLYLFNTASTTEAAELDLLSMSHLVGYESKLSREDLDELYEKGYLPSDDIGKTGVEKSYESDLRGVYGKKRIEVNAYGREQSIIAEEPPSPGDYLELSIDIEMQRKLEELIAESLKKNNLNRASGIAIDPRTGEILAMVSLPSYNNNQFSGGISYENYASYTENENRPLFNRSIAGTYPSGSTIKPAIAAVALQEGIINEHTTVLSNGGVRISYWFFPDWQAGGHGLTDVSRAIAWSVNTFFYYIGGGYQNFEGLGVDRIVAYLKEFGFANKLGIDLPGEMSGLLPSKEWKEEVKKEQWYIGDTYNLSIGQGDLLVTPLQIASMTSVVANGGTLYRPHLVTSLTNPITNQERFIEPEILNDNFINSDYFGTIRLGMRECVTYGACSLLSNLPFDTAGKTGTAQWSSTKEDHAWYTSFAPYRNPEIVLTILIEEGTGGSKIAAPIAYDFYKWWNSERQKLN